MNENRLSVSRQLRVLLVAPAPVRYRMGFFEELSSHPRIQLTVLYCGGDASRGPRLDRLPGPRSHFLWGFSLPSFSGAKTPHYINPSVIKWALPSRADVLVVSGYGFPTALLAAAGAHLERLPWILWSETNRHSVGRRNGPAGWLKRRVVETLVSSAGAFFVPGTLAADYLQDLGASAERIFRVANTCDVHAWHTEVSKLRQEAAAIRSELRVGSGPVVATVGRLLPDKGFSDLVRAFGALLVEMPEAHLLIVGEGPSRSALERMAQAAGGAARIRFLGGRNERVVQRILAISDVFCLPSWQETWGVVVNESLAAGVPVIVTRKVGAARDLVESTGAGVVVKERDPHILYLALRDLLRDDQRRATTAKLGWSAVQEFSYERSITEFVRGCEAALSGARA